MTVDLGVRGKKALVTAASKGLGYASAKKLLEHGAKVIISSSSEDSLRKAYDALKAVGEVYYFRADLTKTEEIEELFNYVKSVFGNLDILVYVTGSPKPGKFLELSDEDWVYATKLLMLSAIKCARMAADLMTEGGRMIFSISTSVKEPIDDLALSNVARMSVVGLVKTLSRELGKRGILVNGILPGYILTDRLYEIAERRASREGKSVQDVLNEIAKGVPLGRIGSPEEFANVVLFLSSNLSTYVNGTLITVDGGRLRCI